MNAINTLEMFNRFTTGKIYSGTGDTIGSVFSENHKPMDALNKILETPSIVSSLTNYMDLRDERAGFTGDDKANALLLSLAIQLNKVKKEYQEALISKENTPSTK